MPPRDLTAEEFADWFAPRQAVEILKSEYDDLHLSKHVLLERLRGGMVQAAASHSTAGQSGRIARQLFLKIPANHWERVETADPFWRSGDLNYTFREYGISDMVVMRHYDVRFEPQGVRAIVGNEGKAPNETPTNTKEAEPELKERPPVSETHLQVWFEFYKKIDGDMREERALESARLNFSNKSVTRQRIRDLLGPRPMGRPKKTPD